MFRQYIAAIFRELQVWLACTAYTYNEDGQDVWPKYIAVAYNKYKKIVLPVRGKICVL